MGDNICHRNTSQHGSDGDTFNGNLEDEDYLGDVGRACTICIPPLDSNGVFHVTSVILYLLQIKGLFFGQPHKNENIQLKNFIDVVLLFYIFPYLIGVHPVEALSILIDG